MVIINPSNATQPAAFNRPAGPAPILPTDKVLNAVVMGQRAEHLYELASGNLRLMAESQTALRRGEQLLLQVTGRDANQRPTLQVLNTNNSAIAPLLKAMLPQQQGVNQLLASINQLLSNPGDSALKNLTSGLINTLPSRQQVSDPAGLREAIISSGFFMESQLATGIAPPNDLKSALLRLAQQLENFRLSNTANNQEDANKTKKLIQDYSGLARGANTKLDSSLLGSSLANSGSAERSAKTMLSPSSSYSNQPPSNDLPGVLRSQPRIPTGLLDPNFNQEAALKQLLQDSRGAVARLESHQLLHLQQKDPQQSLYLIELPVRSDDGVDVWQLQLQWQRSPDDQAQQPSDNKIDDEQQRRWQINLNFDLPDLGAINTKVIQQGSQLTITFNTESQATRALIEQRQHELSQSLEEQGITDTEIMTHTGISPAASSPLSNHSLLEDKA
jgi:hypothetical protein